MKPVSLCYHCFVQCNTDLMIHYCVILTYARLAASNQPAMARAVLLQGLLGTKSNICGICFNELEDTEITLSPCPSRHRFCKLVTPIVYFIIFTLSSISLVYLTERRSKRGLTN